MSGESFDEKSWNEIKIGREIWPPIIEEILIHYKIAEDIDPKYFQIYKDRARLYYVLGEIEKSNQEYLKWRNLDSKWIEEVELELELRKKRSDKNIHPWNRLKKFLNNGGVEYEEKLKELDEIRRKQTNKEKYEQSETRSRKEEIQNFYKKLNEKRFEYRPHEKYERNKQSETRRRKEEIQNFYKILNEKRFEYFSHEKDYGDSILSSMYDDQFEFEIIARDIKSGDEVTKEIILKQSESFKDYFKYLEYKEENEIDNFQKLYKFAQIKYKFDDKYSFEELISNIDYDKKKFYLQNENHLKKWSYVFCELFIIFYQHLHGLPLDVGEKINFKDILIPPSIPDFNDYKKEIPHGKQNILECCKKLIYEYKNRPPLAEHNIELIDILAKFYEEKKSLKEISEYMEISEEVLRKDFRTLSRVPKKLKMLIEQGKLGKDHILSVEIALFATDFYYWDGDVEREFEVVQLAEDLYKFLNEPENLSFKKEFSNTKFDLSKPIKVKYPKNKSQEKTTVQGKSVNVTKREKENWERNTTKEQRNNPNFKTIYGQKLLDKQ